MGKIRGSRGRGRGNWRGGGRSNGLVKKAIQSQVKMRLGKKTSEVWNFFEQMPHQKGENPKSRCNICNVVFKCPGGSTTGMRGHLERKHPGTLLGSLTPVSPSKVVQDDFNEVVEEEQEEEQEEEAEDFSVDQIEDSETYLEETNISNNSDTHPLDLYDECDDTDEFPDSEVVKGDFEHEEISRSLAYMCVLDLKPLSLHEGDGFRNFVSYFDSSYVLAAYNSPESIKSVAACIEEMYDNEANKMRRELFNKDVSLTIETWNKTNLDKYLIVTAHYVTNDCKLSARLLSTKLLPRLAYLTPDETTLKSNFLSVVKEGALLFGIQEEQITSMVVNSELFEQIEIDQDNMLIVPCLNSIVKLCFENLQKIAAAEFGYDFFDEALKLAYKYIPDYESLSRNPYSLLIAMEENQSTLEQIEDNKIQWNYLQVLIAVLAPVNDIIEITSDEDKVFLSTILPLLYAIKAQLIEGTEDMMNDTSMKPIAESFTKAIMDTLENGYQIDLEAEDYGFSLICICCFLDPRYKALKFITNEQRQSIHNAILVLMTDSTPPQTASTPRQGVLRSRNRENGGSSSSGNQKIPTRSRHDSDSTMNDSLSVLQRILGRNWELISSSEATNEFQKYLNHSVPPITTDPLSWWSQYKRVYPNIYAVASNFLGISAIGSRAQYIFTKLGAELDRTRGTLEDNYVDKILFLHRIVKSSLDEPSVSQFQSALSGMDEYGMYQEGNDVKDEEEDEDDDEVC